MSTPLGRSTGVGSAVGAGPRRADAGGEERNGGKEQQAAHRLVMAAGKLAGKRPDG